MAYISLYRTYRPQTFADVVGQEHVTTTLRNAIMQGRVASGYLFSGTRGTAKTTCARILAKALNCVGPDGTRTTANPDPCGVCPPCVGIAASSFVDVLEMDAASHGKVDDVRDLVASIKFPPMEGRTKVYIIDEAHQLSRDAMDAFLKTLEEPPPQVVFVLATTEQDKLPITIASRCQTFEFKRGSVAQIAARVADVLQAESVTMDAAAVQQVARAADGSYRDSLSLLEQVLAYKRDQITARDVSLVLGAVDEDVLDRIVNTIADSNAAGVLALTAEVLEAGRDVRAFLKSLSSRLRDLLYLGVGAHPEGGEASDELRTQATRFSPAALLDSLSVLTEAEQDVRRTPQGRLVLEMALLRLVRLPTAPSLPAAGTAPVPPPVASMSAAPPPASAVRNGTSGTQERKQAPPPDSQETVSLPQIPHVQTETEEASLSLLLTETEEVESSVPAPLAEMPNADEEEATDLADEDVPDDDEDVAESDGTDDEDVTEDLTLSLTADDEVAPSRIVTSAEDAENDYHADDDLLQVQQVAASVPAAGLEALTAHAQRHPASEDAPEELLALQKSWQEVVNRMSSKSPAGGVLVKDARPSALNGHTFTLVFSNPMFVDKLEQGDKAKAARTALEDVINKTLDTPLGTYKVKAVQQGKEGGAGTSRPARRPTEPPPDEPSPLLDEVIAVFGGRVIEDK